MSTTMTPTGSIKEVMDELVALEETVDPQITVYRWHPLSIDPPAIFNWIAPSPFAIKDQVTWRDTLTIIARLAVRHSDHDMESIETYADAFRDVIDKALWKNRPLRGTVTKAARASMNMASIEFGGIPHLAVEFPLTFQLDRRIVPNVA